jgi:hypothetical protein
MTSLLKSGATINLGNKNSYWHLKSKGHWINFSRMSNFSTGKKYKIKSEG